MYTYKYQLKRIMTQIIFHIFIGRKKVLFSTIILFNKIKYFIHTLNVLNIYMHTYLHLEKYLGIFATEIFGKKLHPR